MRLLALVFLAAGRSSGALRGDPLREAELERRVQNIERRFERAASRTNVTATVHVREGNVDVSGVPDVLGYALAEFGVSPSDIAVKQHGQELAVTVRLDKTIDLEAELRKLADRRSPVSILLPALDGSTWTVAGAGFSGTESVHVLSDLANEVARSAQDNAVVVFSLIAFGIGCGTLWAWNERKILGEDDFAEFEMLYPETRRLGGAQSDMHLWTYGGVHQISAAGSTYEREMRPQKPGDMLNGENFAKAGLVAVFMGLCLNTYTMYSTVLLPLINLDAGTVDSTKCAYLFIPANPAFTMHDCWPESSKLAMRFLTNAFELTLFVYYCTSWMHSILKSAGVLPSKEVYIQEVDGQGKKVTASYCYAKYRHVWLAVTFYPRMVSRFSAMSLLGEVHPTFLSQEGTRRWRLTKKQMEDHDKEVHGTTEAEEVFNVKKHDHLFDFDDGLPYFMIRSFLCMAIGLPAFASKVSKTASQMEYATGTIEWLLLVAGFLSQVLFLVQYDRVLLERSLHFVFAGTDAIFQHKEMALMEVYKAYVAERICVTKPKNWIAILYNFNHLDVQRLALSEITKPAGGQGQHPPGAGQLPPGTGMAGPPR